MFKKLFPKKSKDMPNKLYFKSGEAFFEYQCKFGNTEIVPETGLVSLVLDSKKEFGAIESTKLEDDGTQTVALKVVSEDGGFVVIARTATKAKDKLNPGDTVIWVPIQHIFPEGLNPDEVDERFGWVGFIVAKIENSIDLSKSDFDVICSYLKS